jgi:hypothetical protein
MEVVDCDVGAQNTVEVSEPESDICGGDRRTGAAHHYDQCTLQGLLRSINFIRAVHHTVIKQRAACRITHRWGLRQQRIRGCHTDGWWTKTIIHRARDPQQRAIRGRRRRRRPVFKGWHNHLGRWTMLRGQLRPLRLSRSGTASTTTAGGCPMRLNLATTMRAPTKAVANTTGRVTERSCCWLSAILRLVARFTTAEAARWIGAVASNVVLGEAVET